MRRRYCYIDTDERERKLLLGAELPRPAADDQAYLRPSLDSSRPLVMQQSRLP